MSEEDIGETAGEAKGEGEEDTIGEYQGCRNYEKEREGRGRTLLPNGDYYEGQYRRNKRHGVGLYVFMKSGARYTGQYFNNLKHGIGTFYYPDGSIYEGEWKNDKKHGYGIYMYPNGDVYEGQWYQDLKEGIGYYKFKEMPTKYLSTWRNGVMEGPGQQITNQYRYHGNWKDNLPYGDGCFAFQNESMLHGFYIHQAEEAPAAAEQAPGADDESETERPPPLPALVKPHWRVREVTKFLSERLPPEPRPFEYPESEPPSSPPPLDPPASPYQHEIFQNIARFDQIYLDEKKLAEASSWDNEIDPDAYYKERKLLDCEQKEQEEPVKDQMEEQILPEHPEEDTPQPIASPTTSD